MFRPNIGAATENVSESLCIQRCIDSALVCLLANCLAELAYIVILSTATAARASCVGCGNGWRFASSKSTSVSNKKDMKAAFYACQCPGERDANLSTVCITLFLADRTLCDLQFGSSATFCT